MSTDNVRWAAVGSVLVELTRVRRLWLCGNGTGDEMLLSFHFLIGYYSESCYILDAIWRISPIRMNKRSKMVVPWSIYKDASEAIERLSACLPLLVMT